MNDAFASELATWHDFYLGTMTAAAALAGLVFLAIALRPTLLGTTERRMRGFALSVFGRFVVVTAMSALFLIPGHPPQWLGAELAFAYVAVVGLVARSVRSGFVPWTGIAVFGVIVLTGLTASVALLQGETVIGLAAAGAATVIQLLSAFASTWFLLGLTEDA